MGQLVNDVTDILNMNSDYKREKKAAESERKKVLEQIATDEKAKANLVKKTLAAQRAKYGAGGGSNKSMTEEAVLKRLREETEEPFIAKKKANEEKLLKIKSPKRDNLIKKILGFIPEPKLIGS
jgi:hypothetical protein